MDIIKEKYDYIGEFYQGVAIVVKDDKYGAILVGGHEIIPPTYDYISTFKDGYAQTIRKGECKILDLSGRECKKYNDKIIPIPPKYDSVRDFKNGYACVSLNGKWGVIDTECREIFEPQFYYLSDFIEGTAKYKTDNSQYENSWGYINSNGFCSECNLAEPIIESDGNLIIERRGRKVRINNVGQLVVNNGNSKVTFANEYLYAYDFVNGFSRVQDITGNWGMVNVNGKIVIPIEYSWIKDFSENKTFGLNKNGKLCLISLNGSIIKTFDKLTDAQPYKNGYAIVFEKNKTGLINSLGEEILTPINGNIHYTDSVNEFDITLEGKHGYFNVLTKLYIKPLFKKIIEIQKDSIKVEIEQIGEGLIDFNGRSFIEGESKIYLPKWCLGAKKLTDVIYAGISEANKWGLINSKGETLVQPIIENIGGVQKNIITIESRKLITINSGWNKSVKEVVKYGLYNIDSNVLIPAEYDLCPELNTNFYKTTNNNLHGIVDLNGALILKPEWKNVYFENGYYIFSKIIKKDYSQIEKFGIADIYGNIIFDANFDELKVLKKGLYKVRYNKSWTLFKDDGMVSKNFYDEINFVDNGLIKVSEKEAEGYINEEGIKIILTSNGDTIELPSKFSLGQKFENGIAKVCIDGYENYIDKQFNVVINYNGAPLTIETNVDYLISQDLNGNYIYVLNKQFGVLSNVGKLIIEAKYQSLSQDISNNYIFLSNERYGLFSKEGVLLIEAKYESLSPLAENRYVASLSVDDKIICGVIDSNDNVILAFDYSSIKVYGGRIPKSFWNWDGDYVTENIKQPTNSKHWLIRKNKYGLTDTFGRMCIQPECDDILEFEHGFFVKKGNFWGILDDKYSIICEPQYSTITSIDNGLWKVSIITSQTYNNKTEVFGILDSYGKERLEPIYQFIGDVNDDRVAKGRAIINLKGQLGLVDENYCILAEPQYEHISEFKNGKAIVNKRIFKQNTPGVDIVRGEIDINGLFTDISEIAKTEVHSISNAATTNSNVKTIKTLSNGYVVIQKDDPSPIYQYCAIIDENNNIILPYKYHRIEELENGMHLVYLSTGYGGNYGLLDQEFKEIIAPRYNDIRLIEDMLIASNSSTFYTSRGNYGLIDLKGNIVLPFEYSSIEFAAGGLVWIHKDQKIGLATTGGKVLIEPCYGKVEPYVNGFAKVNNGYWYEYDEDNDSPVVHTITEYSEGKWGLINSEGILILPPIYDSIRVLENNQIVVSRQIDIKSSYTKTHVSGVTNYQGELLIKDCSENYILASKKYEWQEDFNTEGYSKVYYNGNIGVVNEKFQQIVSCQIEGQTSEIVLLEECDWGYNSESQFVIIEKDHKRGIIDHTNRIIIKPVYDQIDVLSDNTSFVFKCGAQNNNNYRLSYTWSIINVDGKPVIDIQSEDIIHLGFSLFAIKNNNKYSIVDFNGQSICETSFDVVFCFGVASSVPPSYSWETPKKVDGLKFAIVGLDGKYGIIDNQGRLVIHPKYSSLLIQNNGQFLADGILINAFEQKIVVKDNSIFIMPGDYDKIERLENGILLVSKNELFGCVNQIGTVIIPLKYRSLTYQNNLLIAVCYDDTDETYKCGVLDFQENQIVPFNQQIDEIKIESEIILYKQDWHWGAYTLQGKIICEPIYDHIVYVANNLIKVGMDGKDYKSYNDYYWEDGERYDFTNYNEYSIINWGLINNNGNEILPLEYRAIADKVTDGLLEIRSNKRIGYVDVTGQILLEPTYKSVGEFVDGYAVVSKVSYYYDENGRDREGSVYGVINSQFKEIIPCVFDSIEYEVEIGRFKTDVGYKTIDGKYVAVVNGKELFVDKKYKYCKPFGDTCSIAVRVADGHVKYGLIDKQSSDILPPIFSRLDLIENELYKFKINDLYGLVTSKGNIILQNKYNGIGKFEDNLACVQINALSKKLYGYIDSSGNEILPPSYEFIGKRNHKYAVVMKNNLWGLFGIENHQLKIFPNVSFLGPCMENHCKINIGGMYDKNSKKTTGGLWGYVSVDGQVVIEPIYEQAYGFSDGMAAVKLNGKWGFINSEGIIVVPCEYDEVEASFKDGKGKLVKDDEIYIFDKSGSQIDTYDKPRDDDDYYDGGYYDDTPSIYDNPYYNDNLDMDQQSIEFWNSL